MCAFETQKESPAPTKGGKYDHGRESSSAKATDGVIATRYDAGRSSALVRVAQLLLLMRCSHLAFHNRERKHHQWLLALFESHGSWWGPCHERGVWHVAVAHNLVLDIDEVLGCTCKCIVNVLANSCYHP